MIGNYSLRLGLHAANLAGCFLELLADGQAVLVVDGQRLFRFDSSETLLEQYGLVLGERCLQV